MNHLFRFFLDSGAPPVFAFQEEHVGSYKEPKGFVEYAATLESPLALRRVEQLRINHEACWKVVILSVLS
jgi:hypothetical protein